MEHCLCEIRFCVIMFVILVKWRTTKHTGEFKVLKKKKN